MRQIIPGPFLGPLRLRAGFSLPQPARGEFWKNGQRGSTRPDPLQIQSA